MKKLLALILTIGMIFTLAACGGDKNGSGGQQAGGSEKIDYANMTEDDLIKKFIKDEKNITLDEFINLASTYSYATINDKLELDENITDKAIKKLKDNKATLPAAKEILKTEKEPYVIKRAVKALGNEGGRDAEIGKFLLNAAKNENAVVRRQAAVALGSSWNKTLDGAVDAEIKLMKDSDNEVRKAAYEYAGLLGDDRVVAPISEMLKNDADADLHASGVRGLVWLWYDYPSHKNTSEAAYRATIDYLKTTPGSNKVPAWAAVTSFTNKSNQNYASWRERATYFNTDELYEVMLGIVKNENLSHLARGYACKPVAAHCSKEQFEAFGEVVNALTDKNAKFIQGEYQNQAKKLE